MGLFGKKTDADIIKKVSKLVDKNKFDEASEKLKTLKDKRSLDARFWTGMICIKKSAAMGPCRDKTDLRQIGIDMLLRVAERGYVADWNAIHTNYGIVNPYLPDLHREKIKVKLSEAREPQNGALNLSLEDKKRLLDLWKEEGCSKLTLADIAENPGVLVGYGFDEEIEFEFEDEDGEFITKKNTEFTRDDLIRVIVSGFESAFGGEVDWDVDSDRTIIGKFGIDKLGMIEALSVLDEELGTNVLSRIRSGLPNNITLAEFCIIAAQILLPVTESFAEIFEENEYFNKYLK